MTFNNPVALWGLLLIAVPVIIHLFSFRKYKKVLFSNLAFLSEVKNQRQSSSTIKKLLVLACRILAIFLVVLAFAQPTWDNEVSTANQRALWYLDNSLSMQQVDESGEPVLFQAVNSLQNQLDKSKYEEIRLINNSSLVGYSGEVEDMSDFQVFSSHSQSLHEILDKADLYSTNEVSIFSDFQKGVYDFTAMVQDTNSSFQLFHMIAKDQSNLYVDSVQVAGGVVASNEHVLTIGISNAGNLEVDNAVLRLKKDGRQLITKTFSILPHGKQTLELLLEEGDIYGEYLIELTDVPVVFDNEFHFFIPTPAKAKVVLLDEGISESGDYIENVYDNKDYFHFSRENVASASVNSLLDADLVILSEIATIPEWFIRQMGEINGKKLVIPARSIDLNSYARMGEWNPSVYSNTYEQRINSKTLDHPFLSGVFTEKQTDRAVMPLVNPLYEVQGYFEKVLKTNEDKPVLSRVGDGSDEFYFLSSPLGDDYGDFHKHALFVPIMYKLAFKKEVGILYFRLGREYFETSIDSVMSQAILKLSSGDDEFIPSYRLSTHGITVEIPPEMEQPGIYYLTNEKDTIGTFAFNYSTDESNILTYDEGQLQELVAAYPHISYHAVTSNVLEGSLSELEDEEMPLWKYALILALIFILIESFLLRFLK